MSDVDERRSEWIRVVNRGSVDGYADLVARDVVWLPPAGAPIEGREAFRRWLEPFFEQYDYEFDLDPVQVRMFEGWCAEVGRFRSVLVRKGSDDRQAHGDGYFVLWRLDPDTVWRIERYVDGIGQTMSGARGA